MSDDIATKLVAAILGASASIIASTAAIHGSLTAAVGPFQGGTNVPDHPTTAIHESGHI